MKQGTAFLGCSPILSRFASCLLFI